MSNISTPFIFDKMQDLLSDEQNIVYKHKPFTIPFTEHDVLDLQAMFVKPGIHTITTKDVQSGRKIITTILDSLNYYHAIGCITQEQNVPIIAYDIMTHITQEKNQPDNILANLENFFAIYPCFDFIWVEFSKNAEKKYSLQDIEKIFSISMQSMPILIVEYEDN